MHKGVAPPYIAMSLSATASEVVRLLFDAVADKDIAMQGGATTLFIASQSGHLEVICLLSDAGADRGIAMQGGATPLFVASRQGRQEVVCLLPDAGADTDIISEMR